MQNFINDPAQLRTMIQKLQDELKELEEKYKLVNGAIGGLQKSVNYWKKEYLEVTDQLVKLRSPPIIIGSNTMSPLLQAVQEKEDKI